VREGYALSAEFCFNAQDDFIAGSMIFGQKGSGFGNDVLGPSFVAQSLCVDQNVKPSASYCGFDTQGTHAYVGQGVGIAMFGHLFEKRDAFEGRLHGAEGDFGCVF
jgi:hypothetical protein